MDLDATPVERKQLEYATQHFGFTPDSLTDTITSFALDHLAGVLNVSRFAIKEYFQFINYHFHF